MAISSNLIILLLVLVGGCLLQVFLARRASRWPGLALPLLSLLYALLLIGNIAATPNGTEMAIAVISALLLGLIPFIVLMTIYFVCRAGLKRRREIEKMHIQDLD